MRSYSVIRDIRDVYIVLKRLAKCKVDTVYLYSDTMSITLHLEI